LGFRITICRGWISIDRAEVPLTKDQGVTHRPILREADQGVIHGEIAVRMVLAHHFADDTGAFTGGAVGIQAHLLHRVENATMHGLESVTNIGKRAADDDRHRVVEIRAAHLLFDVDGLNVQRTGTIATGRRSQRKFWIWVVRHSSLSAVSVTLPPRNFSAPCGCDQITRNFLVLLGVTQPGNSRYYSTAKQPQG